MLDRCGSDFRLESTVRCGERRQDEMNEKEEEEEDEGNFSGLAAAPSIVYVRTQADL